MFWLFLLANCRTSQAQGAAVLGFCLDKLSQPFVKRLFEIPLVVFGLCGWVLHSAVLVWALYSALSVSAAGSISVPVRCCFWGECCVCCHTHNPCHLIHISEPSPWSSLGTKWTRELLQPCGQGTLLSVRHSGCRTTLELAGSKPPTHGEMLCWQHLSNSCFMLLLHSTVC